METKGPLPLSLATGREGSEGKGGDATVAIVWACRIPVEEYVGAGRSVVVPRPDCVICQRAMMFWSGYERSVRVGERDYRLWVRRARCRPCGRSVGLVPSFCLVGRLYGVEVVGGALAAVLNGGCSLGVVADRLKAAYTTVREWLRRFRRRAAMLAAGFAALVVEIGGVAPRLPEEVGRAALAAIGWVWLAARLRAGRAVGSCWSVASLVTGGGLLAATRDTPWIVLGKRRWIPPVP